MFVNVYKCLLPFGIKPYIYNHDKTFKLFISRNKKGGIRPQWHLGNYLVQWEKTSQHQKCELLLRRASKGFKIRIDKNGDFRYGVRFAFGPRRRKCHRDVKK